MKALKIGLLICGLFFIKLQGHAFDKEALNQFELAVGSYNQAEYDSALVLYNGILESGITSDALLYNIGNSYFKLKDYPSAILFYEKALKLKPSDEAIRHNLAMANNMIVDKIEPMPEIFLKTWWRTFYNLLSADSWAWISVVLFALTLLLAFIYFVSNRTALRKVAFFVGLFILFLFVGSFGLASQKYYYTQNKNEAIVFTPTITVKSAPSASTVDLFVLHEGTKVLLLDEVSGWNRIRIANGSTGWLPSNVLKGI